MKLFGYILLFSVLVAKSAFAQPQSGRFDIDSLVFDFGTITEEGGVVRHDFMLHNSGTAPLVVVDMRASCGCTTFEYSRRPLLSGEKMPISVVFNPLNQAGSVMRKIYLRTSVADTVLMLRGKVLPRRRSAAERCQLHIGESLFIESNAHDFGIIEQGSLFRSSFSIYNNSDGVVQIGLVPTIESGMLDIRYPHELQPGEEAVIDFGYITDEKYYGTMNDIFAIDVNGKRSDIQLIISGVAVDCRAAENIKGAAKMELSENFIKFGTLKHNSDERCAKIEILNSGTAPLYIRRIESQFAHVGLQLAGSATIAVGERRYLKISILPSRQSYGAVTDRVRIICNDMESPLRSIRISAIIED